MTEEAANTHEQEIEDNAPKYIFVVNFEKSSLRVFAPGTGNVNSQASETDDVFIGLKGLTETSATGPQLVALYNSMVSDPLLQVKKFSDRKAAVRRVWGALVIYAQTHSPIELKEQAPPAQEVGQETEIKDRPKRGRPPKEKAPKEPKPEGERKRSERFGQTATLYPQGDALPSNPRRADSHGWRSLEIIRTKPGISVNEFLKAGGRLNDLRWDIEYGRVRVDGDSPASEEAKMQGFDGDRAEVDRAIEEANHINETEREAEESAENDEAPTE